MADGDANGAYRGAHTLKGSVGNFDAHEAVAIAQRLEARAREGDIEAAKSVFAALEREMNALLASAGQDTGDTPMRILIAEDDRVTARLLTGLLASWGYETVVADGRRVGSRR